MNYLYAANLSKSYGDKDLFLDVSISINKGQKVALIARNGSGKTSLLRILAGLEPPDSGSVEIHSDISIGFLEQDTYINPEFSVKEAIFSSNNPVLKVIREYENAIALQATDTSPALQAKVEKLMEQMEIHKAWDYEFRIDEILSKLELKGLKQKAGVLSGGQRKRIALASILIQEPDFIILDEPTNHLDIGMIEWLEGYLSTKNTTLLVVTHDRYFLDKISDEIIEIDNGVSYKYKGGYPYFLEKKNERLLNKTAQMENTKKLMKKELEWMRRQPKARGTKAKSRQESFYQIEEKASEKITDDNLQLDFKSTYIGKKIVEFEYIDKSYGDLELIKEFHYKFKRYDRIGIVGNNGTGKTTFIKMMIGEEQPTAGKIVVGQTVKFGFFRQEAIHLDESKRIIETVREIADYIVLGNGKKMTALQLLLRFMFPKETHFKYVSVLSGGERRRLQLLMILMKNPNFLILDEPTNDLDLATLNVLEDFLAEFAGCLVVVTHDRYFMDRLVEHLFVFEGDGKVRDFPGNYTQYRLVKEQELKAERAAAAALPKPKKEKKKAVQEKKKLTFKEKNEFEGLEAEIEVLEEEKAALEVKLGSGSSSSQEIMEWSTRLGEVVSAIEQKSDRWLELSEYV